MITAEKKEVKTEIKTMHLPLEGDENARFTVVGNGPHLVYVMGGLGSYYLKGLMATGLTDKVTLIAHNDPLWVHNKTGSIDESAVKRVDLETIMRKEKQLVQALKKHFKCAKISLFGFSALAALASEYALRHPEDVACLVETGAGLCELDPTFKLTDEILKIRSPGRYGRFLKEQAHHENVLAGKAAPLPGTNFFEAEKNEKHKRTPTPNSRYRQWVYSITPKLAYNDETEEMKNNAINHWENNVTGEVVHQPMREHFFNNIFPKLNPLNLVNKLEEKGIPTLLIQGADDYITPLGEGVAKVFEAYEHVKLTILPKCGHMSYYEHPQQYKKIVDEFLTLSLTPSAPHLAESTPTTKASLAGTKDKTSTFATVGENHGNGMGIGGRM